MKYRVTYSDLSECSLCSFTNHKRQENHPSSVTPDFQSSLFRFTKSIVLLLSTKFRAFAKVLFSLTIFDSSYWNINFRASSTPRIWKSSQFFFDSSISLNMANVA